MTKDEIKERFEFEDDGSFKIDDVRFKAISENAKDLLKDDKAWKLNRLSYDVFNTDGTVFIGHLNISFDGVGNYTYVEQKPNKLNPAYLRSECHPIFMESNSNIPETIFRIGQLTKECHEENNERDLNEWHEKTDFYIEERHNA